MRFWLARSSAQLTLAIQFFFPLLYTVIGLAIVNIKSFSVVQDKPYAINNDIYELHATANQLHEFSYMNTGKIRANNFIGTLNGKISSKK